MGCAESSTAVVARTRKPAPRDDALVDYLLSRRGGAAHSATSPRLSGEVGVVGLDGAAKCDLDGDAMRTPCCCEDPELTTLKLEKKDGAGAYGVRLVYAEDSREAGLMIMLIARGGAMSQWLERHPSAVVAPGDSIVSVNGVTAPWAILEEMAKSLAVEMVVRRAAPGAMAVLSQCCVTGRSLRSTALVVKRTVRAGDISMDSCAICMEDVESEERVVGLPCGHGFHHGCIVRWLAFHGSGGCPLCREVVD